MKKSYYNFISSINSIILIILFVFSIYFVFKTFKTKEKLTNIFNDKYILNISKKENNIKKKIKNKIILGLKTDNIETIETLNDAVPFYAGLFKDSGFKLSFSFCSSYDELSEKIKFNQIDIAKLSASALCKTKKYNFKILAIKKGKKAKFSLFITRKELNINSITDLKGHSIAFKGKNSSSSGYYFPISFLYQNNISLSDFSFIKYVDDEIDSVRGLLRKEFDVIAIKGSYLKKLPDKEKKYLKIICKTPDLPRGGFVVNNNLNKNLQDKLLDILLSLNTKINNKKFKKIVDKADVDWLIKKPNKFDIEQYKNLEKVMSEQNEY